MTAPAASLSAILSAAAFSSKAGASRCSTVSAPSGQTARQKPAPSQSSSLTTLAMPSTILIAPSAQGMTHRPQPVHFASSIWTMLRVTTVMVRLAFFQRRPPRGGSVKAGVAGRAFPALQAPYPPRRQRSLDLGQVGPYADDRRAWRPPRRVQLLHAKRVTTGRAGFRPAWTPGRFGVRRT